ncbi:MAG: polysaccharide biosynthesis/export family protein [Mucilaginibacter sp.]
MYKTLLKIITPVCSDTKIYLIPILAAIMLSSCGPKRNLVYLSDLSDSATYRSAISNIAEPRIQDGDILGISISNVDPESSNLFNKGLLPVANQTPVNGGTATPDAGGYLVDKAGNVNFPSIGKIKLAGLTLEEAIDKVAGLVGKYVKNPIVNIKLLNFKITVIGEVNKPGVFSIANNKVNVLEALGLAGDMTMYGKRENVVVIHEANGSRTITPMDMNRSNVLQSPAFYLQQNDVVYVKPDKMKEKQARTDTKTISIIVAAATVITVILSRLF